MAKKKKLPKIVTEIQNNPPEPVNFAFEKNISYSQLSMYTQCPKKWALQYRDGHKVREQSIHMTFGTALHETLQMYLDVMYNKSAAEADRIDLVNDFSQIRIEKVVKKEKHKKGKFFKYEHKLKGLDLSELQIYEDFEPEYYTENCFIKSLIGQVSEEVLTDCRFMIKGKHTTLRHIQQIVEKHDLTINVKVINKEIKHYYTMK